MLVLMADGRDLEGVFEALSWSFFNPSTSILDLSSEREVAAPCLVSCEEVFTCMNRESLPMSVGGESFLLTTKTCLASRLEEGVSPTYTNIWREHSKHNM